jgi:hypothetical protein
MLYIKANKCKEDLKMRKLAEIDCACGCGNRVKLYWHDKKIMAKDTHTPELKVVEQHYSRNKLSQAVEDIAAWYADYNTWHLEWAAYSKQ